ncbi:hypothetical protein [Altererythrobacter sp. MF3-039]|uniref:hypothetical protein n=1 Tax=Altererythrobacter sp. MF3-039 TaxID=3252901 RepID=UPI00390CD936
MRFFDHRTAHSRRTGSHIALAIALVTGGAVGAAGFAEPAYAQKKKKKKKDDEEAKPNYTKEFIAVYQPVNELVQSPTPDAAAIKAGIPSVVAAVTNPDERMVAGSLQYTAGQKTSDMALQFAGAAMMLESGKVPPENIGQYNFIAAQLAYQLQNFSDARKYGIAAIDAGYTSNSPEIFVAESFLADNQATQGLEYLSSAIQRRIDNGQEVDESWIKRGLGIAFNANLGPQAAQFGYWFAKQYPSADSWGDAIAVVRNFGDLNAADTLDLIRLTRRTDTFRTRHEFHDYVEAADPRRLPGEVVAVIDQGYGSGLLSKDDLFIADAYTMAKERAESDRRDLASLEADAGAAGAALNIVVAAGDAFLNYDQPAKAERFYTKALGMPGVNAEVVGTRLGIAQFDQGKYAEAQETFAGISGVRKNIARLWATYAEQQDGEAPTAVEADTAVTG